MIFGSILLFIGLLSANYIYHARLAKKIKVSWYDESDMVLIKGKNIHLKIKGSKKPLFLIHGSQMNLYDWRNNIDYLSKYYKVYAIDMIGSGFSDKPKGSYSPRYYAEFILDLMDHYKIEKASFVASSWGGGHVFYLSLLKPDRVEKMVMSSPSGGYRRFTLLERALKTKVLGEFLLLLGNRKIIESELKAMFVHKNMVSKALVDSIFKPLYMKGGFRALLNAYRHEDFSFVENNLQKINHPVLILWGDQDGIHTYKAMKKMNEKIPNCQMVVMKDTGHLPHEEKSHEFNELTLGFLSDA